MLQGKHILLGVTGSIAAYKAAVLCRLLRTAGAEVQVVMTALAKEFITPLTMATLSKRPILVEFFDPENGAWNSHVSLGEWADLMLVAPATANTLSKMAHGTADNLLLTTYLSARCPVAVAPAMDLDMYAHVATQQNLRTLAERGVAVIEPGEGELASGLTGKGRMEEPEAIVRAVERLLAAGVRVMDPANTYVGPAVTVGEGSTLLPGTILRGRTTVGRDCSLGPNTLIRDCAIGDSVTVNSSQLNESVVEDEVVIGPFAYIRPHCLLMKKAKVGDFVELKNSTIGEGTKISHLTYVGDTDAGAHINFGCGTVTVNYDGAQKFRTTIGDGAFIGCNTNLVAPVTIGEGAYTAAGSTITEDVPPDSLAIARERQSVKKNWAKRRRGN